MKLAKKVFAFAMVFSLLPFGLNPVNAQEGVIAIEEIKREDPVDFEKEILPIFRRNCLACHNSTDAESDLVMETPAALKTGGFEGPSVVPGNGKESLIIQLASRARESFMPPDDNDVGAKQLTPKELGLIKLWIDQGAEGEVSGAGGPVAWQPLPAGVNPIYAVDISQNGFYAAAGRANQVFLYHVPSRTEVGRLSDPAILESGIYENPGVAFLDIVQSIAFSPDGTRVAAGGYRTVKIWERSANHKVGDLPATADVPVSAVGSADGKLVAIGLNNGSAQIIEVATQKVVATVGGHGGPVNAVAFSADGTKVLTGSADKTAKLFNVADGAELRVITTPAPVNAVAFAVEGSLVVTANEDNKLRTWPVAAPEVPEGEAEAPVKELNGHGGPVTSVATYGARQELLLSGAKDNTARLWNVEGGNQVRSLNHGGPVTAVAVNADGSKVVSVSDNKTGKLWNAADGKELGVFKGDFNAVENVASVQRTSALANKVRDNAKKDLDDANARKKSEDDNLTKVKEALTKADEDLKTKTEAAVKPNADLKTADEALAAAVTAQEKSVTDQTAAQKAVDDAAAALKAAQEALKAAQAELAAAGDDQAKKDAAQAKVDAAQKTVTDATTAQNTANEGKKTADAAVTTAAAEQKKADDAQKKAAAAAQKVNDEKTASERAQAAAKRSVERAETSVQKAADSIVGFEATHKAEEAAAVAAKEIADKAAADLAATEQAYTSVAFTADGNIAVGSVDQRVWTFSGENAAPIDGLAATGSPIKAIAVVGKQVVSVSENKAVALWNTTASWELIQTIGNPDSADVFVDRVTALDFSADGQLLAAAGGEPSRSGEIKIFNVEDGSLAMELDEPHSDTVFAVDFSRDGQYIASCGSDRFIKVFQVNDGSFVRSFEGHTHHVLGVAWSADGRELASSGADMVMKIWDFRTGDQKRTISGFSKEITSISYVGDTTNVVSSCGDKNVHIKRADNGGNVRALTGSTDFVYSVAVSADGKVVIAGGQDSTVRFWQADNGQSVATFEAPQPEGAVAEGEGE
ncbi:MAG: hypothetical protein CMJ79_12610 [Planctomycetaceae bacterium]|nr:hypothetical protein [Planctomycetaceae bacterium]